MKVIMLIDIETANKTFKKGDIVEVKLHETYKNTYYVGGLGGRELFLNDTPIFEKAKAQAA